VQPAANSHFVDLWRHRLLQPQAQNGDWWIEAETDAFNQDFLGTNNESEVDCIAQLPILITAHRNGDMLYDKNSSRGDLNSLCGPEHLIIQNNLLYSSQVITIFP
jgi:hypothetical protein